MLKVAVMRVTPREVRCPIPVPAPCTHVRVQVLAGSKGAFHVCDDCAEVLDVVPLEELALAYTHALYRRPTQ